MKITTTAVVLFMAPQLINGKYFPAFFRGFQRHRALNSQQCLDQTDDFYNDGSFMLAAFDAVEEEIDEKATCSGSVDLGKSICQVDFETFDSAEQFKKSCETLGGKTIKVNAAIDCGGGVTQITRNGAATGFSFRYDGLMDCVSMECDNESVKEKIDAAVAQAASSLGMTLAATCSYDTYEFESSTAPSDDEQEVMDIDTTTTTVPYDTTASPGSGTEVVKDTSSSGQCRSLMTAAIGVPLLNMALAV